MPDPRDHEQSSIAVAKDGDRFDRRASLLAAGLVLAAYAARVFRLGFQSLWGDEAISVFRALGSLAGITAAVPAEGTLPPLYYYLLHLWMPLAGQTEFAVRFLSLVWGVASVPLLYVLVRRTVGAREAVAAAGVATASPFWIYYSQETRTYAQVTALTLLALYLLARAGSDPRWQGSVWPWAAYSVTAAAALASYYFAGFVLGVGVAWCLIRNRRSPSVVGRCVAAQVGAMALLAPLLTYAAQGLLATADSVTRAGIPIGGIAEHLLQVFTVGISVDWSRVWPLAGGAVVLALAGAAGARRGRWLWIAALLAPIACIYLVSFNTHRGWARYFITASPAWYALVGAGVVGLLSPRGNARFASRWPGMAVGALAVAALAAGVGWSLRNYYFRPEFSRYDFRSVVAEVEATGASGVAIVNGPPRFPSFFYYHTGAIWALEMPAEAGQRIIPIAMAETVAGRAVVWLVKYHPPEYDPVGVVERWLSENAYRHSVSWVENATFSRFLRWPDDGCPSAWSAPVGVTFGEPVILSEYRSCVVGAPGADYLLLDVGWLVDSETQDDLWAFVHVLDDEGRLVGQSDHRLVADTRPSWTWRVGDAMRDRSAIALPPGYRERGLWARVGLRRADGDRLQPSSRALPDGGLELALPNLTAVPPATLDVRLGDAIRLLALDTPTSPVARTEPLRLRLFWHASTRPDLDATVFVHLLDRAGRVVSQRDSTPGGGRRPTSWWAPGEALVDRYDLPLSGVAPGEYRLEVGMYEPTDGRRLPLTVDGVRQPDDRWLLPDAISVR